MISALLACTSSGTVDPGGPDLLSITTGNAQTATVATAVLTDPVVVVTDSRGRPRSNVVVRFSGDTEGDWVTVDSMRTDANGRATTRWYLGPRVGAYVLTAQVGNATVTATATATALQPGTRHVARNQYVEFMVGDLPIVLSAPHGGLLTPAEIPDRTTGETARDSNTDTLAVEIGNAFNRALAHRPHIVIVRLRRSKLDANREIVEAAQGNTFAEIAWREFQGFIEAAREDVRTRFVNGFYIDLHGHGHAIPRLELGYLLTGTELASAEPALNALVAQTSVRTLAQRRSIALTTLLRGPQSLGALLEQEGFAAVPSPANPDPAGAAYFSGGYNTDRHGSRAGGTIDGVQIESHFAGVRDTEANRQRFAASLVTVLDRYFTFYYAPLPR